MKMTRATYRANGKEIEMRQVDPDGAGFTVAVKVGGHREVYHEMGLSDSADLAAAIDIAERIYGKDTKGRPACSNSDIDYLRRLMSDLAGC